MNMTNILACYRVVCSKADLIVSILVVFLCVGNKESHAIN